MRNCREIEGNAFARKVVRNRYGIPIRESGVLEKEGGLTGFLDFLDALRVTGE
jgi:hypothetical protein